MDGGTGRVPGDQLTAADLGFVGLDDSGPVAAPAVITGYKATRNRPLTRGQKLSYVRVQQSVVSTKSARER
ncbi:hypothetical protein [Streptomyces coeruleorubidus]|uniref:hypothetical protein n=1 Tax=Streptomyces coeruleorubidus TaxID=116188 RepID=UPI0036B5A61D